MNIFIENLYEGVGIIEVSLSHDNKAKDCKQESRTILRIENLASAYMKVRSGGDDFNEWFELELEGIESIDFYKTLYGCIGRLIKVTENIFYEDTPSN